MTVVTRGRAAPQPTMPISVNGRAISRAAIAREVQHHPAGSPGASWKLATEALVVRELLLQEAQRLGVVAEPRLDEDGRREVEEEALLRELIDRSVRIPSPSETELRRYYEANRQRFRSAELVEASHILLAAAASDEAAFAEAADMANHLASELAANPSAFAELARAHSDCSSAGEGGFLGQITPAETTAEFAEALSRLSEGETTAVPVRTRYGLHLIRLHRRIPAADLPFEAVADRIAGYLLDRARVTATVQFLARLVSAADIVGARLANAETHRVN